MEQFEELVVAGEEVVMINSDFKTNFELNLPVVFKVLTREYGLQADYSPDSYVGINVKYVSPILIDGVQTTVSFFIFSTGSVIINSAKSIEQQIDAYNFLNIIFKKNYEKIWHANRNRKSIKDI